MLKLLLTVALTLSVVGTSSAMPPREQSTSNGGANPSISSIAQANCDAAIDWVSQDMARLRVKIATLYFRPVYDPEQPWGYPDNPFPDRDRQIIFVLDHFEDGGRAEALMNSTQLQLAYARRVIAACPDIAIVVFGLDASDYIIRLFLLPDQTVKHGIPVPAGDGVQNVPWGHYIFI